MVLLEYHSCIPDIYIYLIEIRYPTKIWVRLLYIVAVHDFLYLIAASIAAPLQPKNARPIRVCLQTSPEGPSQERMTASDHNIGTASCVWLRRNHLIGAVYINKSMPINNK